VEEKNGIEPKVEESGRKPYEKPAIREHESLASTTSFYYTYYYYV
jgi:hypothetical protein